MEKDTHVLVVPYPMQGHVAPMMKLSQYIAKLGVKVTLVLTEHTYKAVASTEQSLLRLVAVPDGLDEDDDRKDESKLAESLFKVMPNHVYDIIAKAKEDKGDGCQVTCMIADTIFGWAHDTAEKTGIKLAMFWTSSPGALASTMRISELVENGVLDQEGTVLKKDGIELLPDMPHMSIAEFPWCCPDKPTLQKTMFSFYCAVEQTAKRARWILCNWFQELSPSASSSIPNSVPVGPLLANGQSSGTLKPEDSTCLTWLDQQPLKSVIYVSFGSMSTLTQNQLDELAYGLELSKRRFLWVVLTGLIGNSPIRLPVGFEERVADHGKVIKWAPQEKVLAHPSVACFLTHCGWNSTMDGISNGVPFLCWPCFADQPYTRTCISESWKIGICLIPDEKHGIILRHEIKSKIDELLSRPDLFQKSRKLKEVAIRSVDEGGSYAALQGFVEQIQQ